MSILAVSGASGVGKSTFMRTFLQAVPGSTLLPGYTTRELRGSEIVWNGIPEYYKLSAHDMLSRDEQAEFLHVFGKEAHNYGALYATLEGDFKAALASPQVHLAALFVPAVELFFDEARSLGRENDMHAIFLDLKDEEERHRRLNKDGTRDPVRFEEELSKWRRLVQKSDAPFYLLDAADSPETLVRKAIEKFSILTEA